MPPAHWSAFHARFPRALPALGDRSHTGIPKYGFQRHAHICAAFGARDEPPVNRPRAGGGPGPAAHGPGPANCCGNKTRQHHHLQPERLRTRPFSASPDGSARITAWPPDYPQQRGHLRGPAMKDHAGGLECNSRPSKPSVGCHWRAARLAA